MISSKEALDNLLELSNKIQIKKTNKILSKTLDRTLASSLTSYNYQPSFSMSAMDGFAIKLSDNKIGTKLKMIGEAPAGLPFNGYLNKGQAIRIFTGAKIPEGAEAVVIQENTTITGNYISIKTQSAFETFIRAKGSDFKKGFVLNAPVKISPRIQLLLASMGHAKVPVKKKPTVAILSTGNELSPITKKIGYGKIIASNSFAISGLMRSFGANPLVFPIIPDNNEKLIQTLKCATELSDFIVTIGGASVGDHDLVKKAAQDIGMILSFEKIRVKPGKPMFAGTIQDTPIIGLPGNPVSAYICTYYFLKPFINSLLGYRNDNVKFQKAILTSPLSKNGDREHFMRGIISSSEHQCTVCALSNQDSSLVSLLNQANGIIIRPQNDQKRNSGDLVDVLRLEL